MLFVLGIIFIIISICITVYNKPKNQSIADAILDSGNTMHIEKASKATKTQKPNKKPRKKIKIAPEHDIVIGDDCSQSFECPKPYPDNGNKNENRCRKILEKIFGQPFPSVRPSWLKNPATKRNLELDMYCHNLKLAAEYDGAQHSKMTKFHGSKKELLYQMQRDQYKNKRCKELGITLLRIPYWAKSDLEGYITRTLKENNLLPE